MNHCQAVRLELLDEKAALHQERVMKDQAATQPCSRLQAAALRPRTSASLCPFSSSTRLLSSVPSQATFLLQPPVNGRGVLLESCVEPGRFVVPQKAGDGDVLLKLLPVCANASCTAEASRFSFDEAVGNLGG